MMPDRGVRRGPRWWHRLYARLAGYFWLPCPVCGRMFGGHEIGGIIGGVVHGDRITPGKAVCSEECRVEGSVVWL